MTQINKQMKIVFDTNVLLVSISRKSKYNWVFQKILNKEINVIISNEILTEYEEKITDIFNPFIAKNIIELFLIAMNVTKIIPYFRWNLIDIDKDDNKFVDCAIASNADYIVTNDKHFDVLKSVDFPKVNVIDINGFDKIFS